MAIIGLECYLLSELHRLYNQNQALKPFATGHTSDIYPDVFRQELIRNLNR